SAPGARRGAPRRGSRARAALLAALCALSALACAGLRGADGRAARAQAPLAAQAAAPRRPQLVLLVAIPGLAPEHFLPAPGAAPLAPRLAALADAGVAVESLQPVYPAARVPALVSLATGLAPDAHGVLSDRPLEDH